MNVVDRLLLLCINVVSAVLAHETRQSSLSARSHGGSCSSDLDCSASKGYSCYWLFDGCHLGQCMCNPRKHKRLASGKCVTVTFGGERCDEESSCLDGMTCENGTCRCHAGVLTADGQHCLRHNHRLLGQRCDVNANACFQKAAGGYERHGVFCSHRGICECQEGSVLNGMSCRNLRIHEKGCTKFYHCEGGAVCVDRKCICPSGYTSSAQGTKCAKRDAKIDLPFGSQCDEINERLYCGYGLVCHRCSEDDVPRCVRFYMPTAAGFLTSSGRSRVQSSVTVSSTAAALMLIAIFSGGFWTTSLRNVASYASR